MNNIEMIITVSLPQKSKSKTKITLTFNILNCEVRKWDRV